MARAKRMTAAEWFANCGGFKPKLDLATLRRGAAAGLLDAQDEYGMTALMLAVSSKWHAGVDELVRLGADTEFRYHQTGATALYHAVLDGDDEAVRALVAAGANPDAANHWGVTPRRWVEHRPALAPLLESAPSREATRPPPHIQNAEHLADHYHPRFEIPSREERETLRPGQAVDLHVVGPKTDGRQDRVKVRITAKHGRRPRVRYTGSVETPVERTHLAAGTTQLEFGPEHVATVYVPRPAG